MKNVSVGIIKRNGMVLACQRLQDARYPLKWEFPGGKVEENESFEDALIRELREELSIDAVVGGELLRQEWTYPESKSRSNESGSFNVRYFLIRDFSGEPVNNAFAQIKWVSAASLLKMDILEGNRTAIEKLIKQEKKPNGGQSDQAA